MKNNEKCHLLSRTKRFSIMVFFVFALVIVSGCSYKQSNVTKNTEIDVVNTDNSDDEINDILVEEMIDLDMAKEMEKIQIDEDYEMVLELERLEDEKRTGKASKGSCNSISESSICLGYYGSFWTKPQMELNCGGGGTFSTSPCPLDNLGGCNMGNGGPGDTVIWFYNRGGSPMGTQITSTMNVCNDNPMSRWINANPGQFGN